MASNNIAFSNSIGGFNFTSYSGDFDVTSFDSMSLYASNSASIQASTLSLNGTNVSIKSTSDTLIDANGIYNIKLGSVYNCGVIVGGSASLLGFFGKSPVSKQTATKLLSTATLTDVINKINGILEKLGQNYYGLFSVS
jgi:hypothetical protein